MEKFTHSTLFFESVEEDLKERLKTINHELYLKIKDARLFCVPSIEFAGRYFSSLRKKRWRKWAYYAVLYIELPLKFSFKLHFSEIEKLALLDQAQEVIPDSYGYDVVDVRVVIPSSGAHIVKVADSDIFDSDALAVIEAATSLIGSPNNVVKSKAVAILADLVEAIREDLKNHFSDSKKSDKFSERLFNVFNNFNIRHYNLATVDRLTNSELDFIFGVTLNLLAYYYSVQSSKAKAS